MFRSESSVNNGVLAFNGLRLSEELCEAVAATIEASTTILEVDLSNNFLSEPVMARMLKAISVNKSISRLNLEGSKLEEGSLLDKVSQLIATNTSIVKYASLIRHQGLKKYIYFKARPGEQPQFRGSVL